MSDRDTVLNDIGEILSDSVLRFVFSENQVTEMNSLIPEMSQRLLEVEGIINHEWIWNVPALYGPNDAFRKLYIPSAVKAEVSNELGHYYFRSVDIGKTLPVAGLEFIGRSTLLTNHLSLLKNSIPQNNLVESLRRFGKTSFIHTLEQLTRLDHDAFPHSEVINFNFQHHNFDNTVQGFAHCIYTLIYDHIRNKYGDEFVESQKFTNLFPNPFSDKSFPRNLDQLSQFSVDLGEVLPPYRLIHLYYDEILASQSLEVVNWIRALAENTSDNLTHNIVGTLWEQRMMKEAVSPISNSFDNEMLGNPDYQEATEVVKIHSVRNGFNMDDESIEYFVSAFGNNLMVLNHILGNVFRHKYGGHIAATSLSIDKKDIHKYVTKDRSEMQRHLNAYLPFHVDA
ncbi:hypothetical protein HN827_09925, partial [archaeon]|nr:hypothetical protein [archaeon]